MKRSCFSFALIGGLAGGIVAGIVVAAAAATAATVGSVAGATASLAGAEEAVFTQTNPIFTPSEVSGTNPFARTDSMMGGGGPPFVP